MANEVIFNLNVFCTLMEEVIIGNLNSNCIVTVDWVGAK